MQGERNHSSPRGGIGLGSDSQLAAERNFVDSSQAEMFLELLRTMDGEDGADTQLAGVDVAVEAVRIALNELMASLVRKRSKTRLVSVGMYESAWLEPSPEQQSCARIDSTGGTPIVFIGMQNRDFRILAQAMMGMPAGGDEAQAMPLASSEKQLLGVLADRLIGKLYTANDPIETIDMPAPARICQPEDALDLADRGCELVLVKFEVAAGSLTLPVEMLFPLEILEAAMAEGDGNPAKSKQGPKQGPKQGSKQELKREGGRDATPVAVEDGITKTIFSFES